MTIDIQKLKEELKAEIITEITASKRTESAWRKAKEGFREKVFSVFGRCPEGWRVLDSVANLSRAVFEVNMVASFTEDDIGAIDNMLNDIFNIVLKYREQRTQQPA